ncbi:hypothetical protein ACIBUY_20965 [Streptomyces sp. NPDC050085]|uniref:hypothetical protein n=1 Tax=Streptomyces sp. NPDC050085 TaxID=3365600 RepID=UPI0037AF5DFF
MTAPAQWPQPPAPEAAPYPHGPGPFPPPPMQNGPGTAAFALGNIGVLAGMVPGLFMVAVPLGVLALVLGLIGYSRGRKGRADNGRSALAGAVLGGVAIVLTVVITILALPKLSELMDRAEDGRDGQGASSAAASPAPVADEPLAFGDSGVYEDGLEVTVSAPVAYKPDPYMPRSAGTKAYRVTVTVVNGTDAKFDGDTLFPQGRDAKGHEAENLYDTHRLTGTIAPGKRATGTYGFDLPTSASGHLDVEIAPTLTEYAATVWSGPTR